MKIKKNLSDGILEVHGFHVESTELLHTFQVLALNNNINNKNNDDHNSVYFWICEMLE